MTYRTLAKSALALLLLSAATAASADLVVLQYHHISNDSPASTSTTPSLFRAQMDMIEQLGLKVVPLQQGTRAALAGDLSGQQQVAITFDDAYRSVWETALPELTRRHYPFTVFVNTGAIGGNDFMSWDQLHELARNPAVEIANHSANHQHLPRRPDESMETWQQRIKVSLDDAQTSLEKQLGTHTPMLAYPYGEFGDNLEKAVASRGWFGYGQQSGPIGPTSLATRLPRFPMATAYGQLNALKDKLLSLALPVDARTLPSGVLKRNPPTLSITLPPGFNPARLTCFASGKGRQTVKREGGQRVSVQADSPFTSRRFRYNCTYPAGQGRFYWLSHQWVDLSR